MLRFFEYLTNAFGSNRIIENQYRSALVGKDKCRNLYMWVEPDRGRRHLEYFKLNKIPIYGDVDPQRIARIDFRSPRYIFHKDLIKTHQWFLNSFEKECLMEFLVSKNTDIPNCDYTNWQMAIIAFNREKGLSTEQTIENLLSDKKLKYYAFLPFDLKMPDYRKLPDK